MCRNKDWLSQVQSTYCTDNSTSASLLQSDETEGDIRNKEYKSRKNREHDRSLRRCYFDGSISVTLFEFFQASQARPDVGNSRKIKIPR
jgi:hypothetical protein